MKRRKDKVKRHYCGYCRKYKYMYHTDFNEHQEDCEREAVMWERERRQFNEDLKEFERGLP